MKLVRGLPNSGCHWEEGLCTCCPPSPVPRLVLLAHDAVPLCSKVKFSDHLLKKREIPCSLPPPLLSFPPQLGPLCAPPGFYFVLCGLCLRSVCKLCPGRGSRPVWAAAACTQEVRSAYLWTRSGHLINGFASLSSLVTRPHCDLAPESPRPSDTGASPPEGPAQRKGRNPRRERPGGDSGRQELGLVRREGKETMESGVRPHRSKVPAPGAMKACLSAGSFWKCPGSPSGACGRKCSFRHWFHSPVCVGTAGEGRQRHNPGLQTSASRSLPV